VGVGVGELSGSGGGVAEGTGVGKYSLATLRKIVEGALANSPAVTIVRELVPAASGNLW
jgi:hypothetical protein